MPRRRAMLSGGGILMTSAMICCEKTPSI